MLDWLVFGSEPTGSSVELITDRAVYDVAVRCFETFLAQDKKTKGMVFNGEEILGLTPEEWSGDLAVRAGEAAKLLAQSGATQEDLLLWKAARNERLWETVQVRVERLSVEKSSDQK